MNPEPLGVLPLCWFVAAATALALVALESGYRLGNWKRARAPGNP